MTAEQENYIRTNFKWPSTWEVIVKRLFVFVAKGDSDY